MIIKCGKEMEARILTYLEQEAEYNTFLTADIVNFGFDTDFQTVYASMEEDRIRGVFLAFYQNLIVAGRAEDEREFFEEYSREKKPQVIMGKEENVQSFLELAKEDYIFRKRPLYHLKSDEKLETAEISEDFKIGQPGEEDKIHAFLMSMDEIKGLYRSKKMIQDRLINRDGCHYYLEKDGELIAHGNSTAIGPYSAMIGGISVKPEYRNRGLGGLTVSKVAGELLKLGRIPCLFSEREEEHNLFTRLGFEKAGMWATLERR